MDACLLCDVRSAPRGTDEAPLCDVHRRQARAGFEAAETLLREHLERAYGPELDAWVQRGELPGLRWHLLAREPTVHDPKLGYRPGRVLRVGRDSEAALVLLRELLVEALARETSLAEPGAQLRVGNTTGTWLASVDQDRTKSAWRALIAELVTVERIEAALGQLPLESAARAVIGAMLEGQAESDELVRALGVLSRGPETLALIRGVATHDNLLVDPLEIADQARVGSGEFTCGWWEIRSSLAEPARQWVELLEGRFPRARAQISPGPDANPDGS